jgi:hypothetical protein
MGEKSNMVELVELLMEIEANSEDETEDGKKIIY